MVGYHVAGSLIQKGGMKLLARGEAHIAESALKGVAETSWHGAMNRIATNSVRDVRAVRQVINDWADTSLFNGLTQEEAAQKSLSHHLEYKRLKNLGRPDPGADWTLRDQTKYKLLHLAKTLPATLPAAYITQRAIVDPLMGEKSNTNWKNPASVLGDFGAVSIQNLATAIIPWEIGGSSLKWAFGDFLAQAHPEIGRGNAHVLARGVQQLLGEVGTDASGVASSLIGQGTRFSYAFGSGIEALTDRANTVPKRSSFGKVADFIRHQTPTGSTPRERLHSSLVQSTKPGGPLEVMGSLSTFWNTFSLEWKGLSPKNVLPSEYAARLSARGLTKTSVEHIADSLQVASGKKDLSFSTAGDFYQTLARKRYGDFLVNALAQDPNIDKNAAEKVVSLLTIKGLPKNKPAADWERRLGFSSDSHLVDSLDDFKRSLQKPLQIMQGGKKITQSSLDYAQAQAERIVDRLGQAVTHADETFIGQRGKMRASIQDAWNQAMRDGVDPYLQNKLKPTKLPYSTFAKSPDEAAWKYLAQETATKLGIKNAANLSERELLAQLDKRGIDPSDVKSLRGFLSTQGRVGAAWQASDPNTNGVFNIFGFRPLTLNEGLKDGFFAHLSGNERDSLQALSKRLTVHNASLGALKQVKIGGAYVSKTGEVLDFNPIGNAIRHAANMAADHLQVPIVHLKPLNILFYGALRSISHKPGVQVLGRGTEAFLAQGQKGYDGALWMSNGAKSKSLGIHNVFDHSGRLHTRMTNRVRLAPTDPNALVGKSLRLAIGDTGLIYDRAARGKLGRAFDFSPDQPSSMGDWARRFANHHGISKASLKDLSFTDRLKFMRKQLFSPPTSDWDSNVHTLARLLSKEGDGFFERLKTPQDRLKFARVFEKLEKEVNLRGVFHMDAIKKIEDYVDPKTGENPFKTVFSSTIKDKPIWSRGSFEAQYDTYDKYPFSHIARYPSSVMNAATRAIGPDDSVRELLSNLPTAEGKNAAHALDVLQRPLRYLTGRKVDPQGLAPAPYRMVGVSRRIDQIRQELLRYQASKTEVMRNMNLTNRGSLTAELLSAVDDLRKAGSISSKQVAEFRAAALSVDINVERALASGAHSVNSIERTIGVAESIVSRGKEVRQTLSQLAEKELDYPGTHLSARVRRRFAQMNPEQPLDYHYNPFGGEARNVLLPTTRSVLARNPIKGMKSLLGINTWSSPESYSTQSIFSSHLFERLNKYFSTFHLGLDPTRYKGPLDFYAKGLVGRRALPAVAAGATFLAADATLGGLVHGKDENGKRVYSPLLLGAAATGVAYGQVGLAGILPGGKSAREKKEEIFEGEVPVRKGRYWPIGSTPFKGGRAMYYHPSWYRRFKSGSQYTGQLWDNPLEKLFFGEDFSPGKLIPGLNYHWERKHYKDRPYPVTGEAFTGPWGPLTGFLNATVGRVIKPSFRMHRKEVAQALSQYDRIGDYGATIPKMDPSNQQYLINDRGRQRVGIPSTAGAVLGAKTSGGYAIGAGPFVGFTGAGGGQQLDASGLSGGGSGLSNSGAAAGQIANVYATSRSVGRSSGGAISPFKAPQIIGAQDYARSGTASRMQLQQINDRYVAAAEARKPISRRGALQSPYYINPRIGYANDVMPNKKPIKATKFSVQASQLGYELQELGGIYGFAFGSAREALGFGTQDMSPKGPVLVSASRAYGSERGFWDRYLGGLGDLPTPFEGEYSNLEVSEIIRRFVPHRRRDINEINPIQNTVGQQYPFLPGSNYFKDFQHGDPYAQVPEGEIRLPGVAYERLNKLHSDRYGKYGLVDQFKILGDIAPYSDQYRSLARIVSSMKLSEEEQRMIATTRQQVAEKKKSVDFHPYKFSHQNFEEGQFTIKGRVEGKADQFVTEELGPNRPIRLAGVRARSLSAQNYIDDMLKPGTKVSARYDPNAPRGDAQDAIVTLNGKNLNQSLLDSGLAYQAKTRSPIDEYFRTSPIARPFKKLGEYIAHLDTPINTKFMQNRTASEDWERRYVYNSTFAQWQHPIRDYLKPAVFKTGLRNPVLASAAMYTIGRMFGATHHGSLIGGAIGGTVGFAASTYLHIKKSIMGSPDLPNFRVKELGIEENADILNYVKYVRLYAQARAAAVRAGEPDPEITIRKARDEKRKGAAIALGPIGQQAIQFRKEIQHTEYGADPFGDLQDLVMAVPKRKREYFQEFLYAPKSERKRILATAPRLERRLLEARWGMPVEKRPDLEEYFSKHELPGPEWQGWDAGVSIEDVKIKVMQQQGLDLSQIGYYPQQVQQANLINPSYPNYTQKTSHHRVEQQLKNLFGQHGFSGNVVSFPNQFGEDRLDMNVGVA